MTNIDLAIYIMATSATIDTVITLLEKFYV
jgi:hypothetical protein